VQINIPEVLAELTQAFRGYEQALLANRPEELNQYFWVSPLALRYGVAENLYGHDEIAAYRRSRSQSGGAPHREIVRETITSYGREFGTTNIEYVRTKSSRRGRQSQTWVRMPEGWRIVSAHVSLLQDAD
jgi:Protein of unknown function (DUF3225)